MKKYKELVDKLSDKNISEKDYGSAINYIEERIDYIWRKICDLTGYDLSWYVFDNEEDEIESEGGTFDPKIYSERIRFYSNGWPFFNVENNPFSDGFPTRFLWTEDDKWIKEVEESVKNSAKKEKEDKAKRKIYAAKAKKKKALISKISKLSIEELEKIVSTIERKTND